MTLPKNGKSIVTFQINGVDVHTRGHAMKLFGQEGNEITLLLARGSPEVVRKIDM